MGIMGFAGSGKTYTAAHTAIGLVEYMQSVGVSYADKPVFFLDTETGSDWVKPQFEAAGIPLFTAKTRAFRTCWPRSRRPKRIPRFCLVDSISHFWKEICDSLHEGEEAQPPAVRGLGLPQGRVGQVHRSVHQLAMHIIICGRAGYEYDYFQDDAGKKQLEKTGIKMKAEGEMGYEPSLLVLMEREMDMETKRFPAPPRSSRTDQPRSTARSSTTRPSKASCRTSSI
jgi:hypothetical protein